MRGPSSESKRQRRATGAAIHDNDNYYVALPFIRATDGTLTPEQAEELPNPDAARRKAAGIARAKGGAAAFARSGDPEIGEFGDAMILERFGEVPEGLSEL